MSNLYVQNRSHSVHHRLLRSQGGPDTAANLVTLSGSGTTGEHGWVHDHPKAARIAGYIVPMGQNPETWPIWRVDQFGVSFAWHLQTGAGLESIGERAAIDLQAVLWEGRSAAVKTVGLWDALRQVQDQVAKSLEENTF